MIVLCMIAAVIAAGPDTAAVDEPVAPFRLCLILNGYPRRNDRGELPLAIEVDSAAKTFRVTWYTARHADSVEPEPIGPLQRYPYSLVPRVGDRVRQDRVYTAVRSELRLNDEQLQRIAAGCRAMKTSEPLLAETVARWEAGFHHPHNYIIVVEGDNMAFGHSGIHAEPPGDRALLQAIAAVLQESTLAARRELLSIIPQRPPPIIDPPRKGAPVYQWDVTRLRIASTADWKKHAEETGRVEVLAGKGAYDLLRSPNADDRTYLVGLLQANIDQGELGSEVNSLCVQVAQGLAASGDLKGLEQFIKLLLRERDSGQITVEQQQMLLERLLWLKEVIADDEVQAIPLEPREATAADVRRAAQMVRRWYDRNKSRLIYDADKWQVR